ncbi:FtsK/SpoIIIE domain-containing protein [Amycolatopsis sp. NBC_01286]|uniref:FtsK/SpoIIIE domain-containing protein n=1 Tax=Amycolatopsis sp. NBC_01286 TaxID=2903560 RepID=UPI002E156D44|nr:FtsK/SpoIIIE domain-containing protein [Amycolatopsis sp. NBC_01286]
MELPDPVVEMLLDELAGGVCRVRSARADHDEEQLASRFRLGFAQQETVLLEDPFSFLVIAQCALIQLSLGVRPEPVPDHADALRRILAESGVHDVTPAVLSATDRLGAFVSAIRHDLNSGLIPGAYADDLPAVVMAAVAFNAPEPLWPSVEARSGTRDRAVRAVDGTDPNSVVTAIAQAEEELATNAIQAAETYAELRSGAVTLRDELPQGELGASQGLLTSRGIDVDGMRALIAARHEYSRSGLFKKIMLGNPAAMIEDEARELLARWEQLTVAARNAAQRAETARTEGVGGLRPLARPFTEPVSRYNKLWPESSRQFDHYRRTEPEVAAELGERRAPHHLWTFDPLPGERWSRMPYLDYRYQSIVFVSDHQNLPYEQACRAVTGIVLDQMSRARPGRLTLTWIDPRGRGQSAGPLLSLLELGKQLIGDAVWSEPDDIAAALRRVSDRMAQLEQRALKDTYPDLDAYNETAGQLAEPNHVVVVTGYPQGFSEDSAQRLRQIMESGARLGIAVLVVVDQSLSHAYRMDDTGGHYPVGRVGGTAPATAPWWNAQLLQPYAYVLGAKGRMHAPLQFGEYPRWVPCDPLVFTAEAANAIVAGYASATESAAEVKIDASSLVEPGTGAVTTNSVDIPLGLQGRREILSLRLGHKLSQNVLVGGLPGSGKSTLFHTLIVNAIRRYDPEELELYLLDFKQGVEFQPYADGALPHARVVAVQSERDFGLSVLRDLRAEIDRRAELLRGPQGAGADGLTEYRERTLEKLPRIVVVVDEFQVLFAEDDRIAHECAQLLDHVVRQGRAFGVHTVLGTQTLRGHGAMGLLRGTLDQVAVRIVLKTSETDSRLFLSDENPAGARLTRPGQAVFNGDGGRPEGNVEFQVAHTEDAARDAAVAEARASADRAGFTRGPRVFDGTKPVDVTQDDQVQGLVDGTARVDGKRLWLHLGLPVAIKGSGGIGLRRAGGSNLLIVHREPAHAVGALAVALATARLSTGDPLRVVGLDCLGQDDEEDEKLRHVLEIGDNATCVGHAKIAASLAELADDVRRRLEEERGGERTILVLNALQRARVLGDENSYGEEGSPRENLLKVLSEGPDYGVHTVVLTDSVDAVDRRLGHGGLSQFGARVVGQCSVDASQRLLGSGAAGKLGEHYVVLHEPDDDRTETLRLFPRPGDAWRSAAADAATRKKANR